MTQSYSRPEIWRLAKYLQGRFGQASDWTVSDQHGWYDAARDVHNEVYRNASPYVRHDVPIEAQIAAAQERVFSFHDAPSFRVFPDAPIAPPPAPRWLIACDNDRVDGLSELMQFVSEEDAVEAAVTIMRHLPDLRIGVVSPHGVPFFVPLAHVRLVTTLSDAAAKNSATST